MKNSKRVKFFAAAIIAIAAAGHDSLACTNVLITRGASADGSCMISYAADSHQLFGELYFRPAADWEEKSLNSTEFQKTTLNLVKKTPPTIPQEH